VERTGAGAHPADPELGTDECAADLGDQFRAGAFLQNLVFVLAAQTQRVSRAARSRASRPPSSRPAVGHPGPATGGLSSVERGDLARFANYRERIRRLKADGDTGFPLKTNSPDSRAPIVSTSPAAFRRFQLSSIILCSELTERLFEV
jgi:hypothetical protein